MIYDLNVQLMDLHNGRIREAVTENEDGSYSIFIEASLSKVEQIEAYNHALRHIQGDHFALRDANVSELLAHGDNENDN